MGSPPIVHQAGCPQTRNEILWLLMASAFRRATDECALHSWRFGFKQSSFNLVAQVLQDDTLHVFRHLPLSQHAIVPSSFRIRVGWVTSKSSTLNFGRLCRLFLGA